MDQERKNCIESKLREGYAPFRVTGGRGSSIEAAAKILKIDSKTLSRWVNKQQKLYDEGKDNFLPDWTLWVPAPKKISSGIEPTAKKPRKFILTAAQDETEIDRPFWNNLLSYANHIGAEIMVGGFTYQKGLFEDHAVTHAAFKSELIPYLSGDVVDLSSKIVWYGRANILPPSSDPLAGLS